MYETNCVGLFSKILCCNAYFYFMKKYLTLICCLIAIKSLSQEPPGKIKVFIDCSNVLCDYNFLRTEITLVDLVSNRNVADVHVLITAVENGNGGKSYQLIFFGSSRFANNSDTLKFNTVPNSTSFEVRETLANYIKLGLIPIISKMPLSKHVKIEFKMPIDTSKAISSFSTKDPWNYWVMRIGVNGSLNADQVYKSTIASGNISANRTTDKIKLNFSVYAGYNKYEYTFDNNGIPVIYNFINTDYQVQHSLVKSISKHWGFGYDASVSNNTFSNNKLRSYFKTAFEYSFFPYQEVNNRLLTISYGVHVRSNKYYDTTIYLKTSELLYGQTIQARLSLNKKWGTVSSQVSYSNYLHDPSLNNLYMRLQMDVRITGGLSFSMYTSGGLVRDQVFLVKGTASEQDILTRRRQIASDYNIYSGVGISYRFGSVLNNFVNPRLEGL